MLMSNTKSPELFTQLLGTLVSLDVSWVEPFLVSLDVSWVEPFPFQSKYVTVKCTLTLAPLYLVNIQRELENNGIGRRHYCSCKKQIVLLHVY